MADPLVEALARTILRHQLGCDQPAEPPAWMVAAATEIADELRWMITRHSIERLR